LSLVDLAEDAVLVSAKVINPGIRAAVPVAALAVVHEVQRRVPLSPAMRRGLEARLARLEREHRQVAGDVRPVVALEVGEVAHPLVPRSAGVLAEAAAGLAPDVARAGSAT